MSIAENLMTAALCIAAASLPAHARTAGTDVFSNGESFYGSLGNPAAATRTEEVSQSSRLRMAWGETVTFRSQGQQFSWTFNGLDHRSLRLAQIAPPGFNAADVSVHVGPNPLNRGGRP